MVYTVYGTVTGHPNYYCRLVPRHLGGGGGGGGAGWKETRRLGMRLVQLLMKHTLKQRSNRVKLRLTYTAYVP